MEIQYEKEICKYLNIPSIPKREWDGEKSFLQGCAVVNHMDGRQSYAVVTYDKETDVKPRIKKVFTLEQYFNVERIFVVPSYMDTNVDDMDLDEESKKSAKWLIEEAKEMMVNGDDSDFSQTENEYFFDNISNDDEARAFIKAYRKKSGKKKITRMPKKHDEIVVMLSVIYNEINKKNKK